MSLMKILLIDDDVFLRDMYATKFQEHGDEVVSAKNGAEALSMITDDFFDIIILDMVMPGMSGLELLASIKKIASAQNSKCIVLSNQSEDSDIKEAYEEGAAGYIVKAESIPSEVVVKVHALVS